MKYYKLNNGVKEYYGNMIILGDSQIINPTREQLLQAGYTEESEEKTDAELIQEAINEKLSEIQQADDLSNEFFVNGVSMWMDKDLRTSIRVSTIPALQSEGKTEITLWGETKGGVPVSFTLPIDTMIVLLNQLEVYAKKTYDLKMIHTSEVLPLIDVTNIKAYNVSKDYPDKLTFNI